jgi:hypothetical protein
MEQLEPRIVLTCEFQLSADSLLPDADAQSELLIQCGDDDNFVDVVDLGGGVEVTLSYAGGSSHVETFLNVGAIVAFMNAGNDKFTFVSDTGDVKTAVPSVEVYYGLGDDVGRLYVQHRGMPRDDRPFNYDQYGDAGNDNLGVEVKSLTGPGMDTLWRVSETATGGFELTTQQLAPDSDRDLIGDRITFGPTTDCTVEAVKGSNAPELVTLVGHGGGPGWRDADFIMDLRAGEDQVDVDLDLEGDSDFDRVRVQIDSQGGGDDIQFRATPRRIMSRRRMQQQTIRPIKPGKSPAAQLQAGRSVHRRSPSTV